MTRVNKIYLLTALYAAQGLPYGFFTQALPVFLRKAELTLPAVGASYLLTLPWALKFLWAPLVDRWDFARLGLRRSWIVPIQFVSVFLFLALSQLSPTENLEIVMVAFLATNLLAASQDIATDGLAIDLLSFEERGWANGIQVAAYRAGMIMGGGAILFFYDIIGWSGAMLCLGGLAFFCTVPALLYREPRRDLGATHQKIHSVREAAREVLHFVLRPGAIPWVIVLLLYKTAHASATGMLRPWLVDRGYSLQEIATILGTAGFIAGLMGAMTGGGLASRFERRKLLIILGFIQSLAVTSYLLPVMTEHAMFKVTLAIALDHFTSGMATATLFALMMDTCDPKRAGSDYTVQACLVVIATGAAGALSGVSAGYLGYETHFLLSAALAFFAMAGVTLLIALPQTRRLLQSAGMGRPDGGN